MKTPSFSQLFLPPLENQQHRLKSNLHLIHEKKLPELFF